MKQPVTGEEWEVGMREIGELILSNFTYKKDRSVF